MEERGGEEIHPPQLEHPSFSSWLLIYATNTRLLLYIGSLALKWKLGGQLFEPRLWRTPNVMLAASSGI